MQRYGNLLKHGLKSIVFNTILTYSVLKLAYVIIAGECSVAICESLYVEDYGANYPGKSVRRQSTHRQEHKGICFAFGIKI